MFNKEFLWGVSTASYQIEGGYLQDNKSLSIWDSFTNKKGNTYKNQNGNIACNHYNRYKEDIKYIKELGVNVYRFSISWCRILPNNLNQINDKGVNFYNNLIDQLIQNNITPFVTLFHWDLPEYLQQKGGFLNDDFPNWFEKYTEVICNIFKDKVTNYITFNEPENSIYNGLVSGAFAPGLKLSSKDVLKAIHNILLAHGKAVKVIRKLIPNAKIGFSACGWVPVLNKNHSLNEDDAYQDYFDLKEDRLGDGVGIWYDPIFLGKYPDRYYQIFKDSMPEIKKEDMELISQKIDFCGINLYSGYYVENQNNKIIQVNPTDRRIMDNGYTILPEVMYYSPKFLYRRYKTPIIVTESGCGDFTKPINNKIHDKLRIECLHSYLSYLEKAYNEGVDIKGYFHWSLMDNFEWNEGFRIRMGLIYVDYSNHQKRIKKDSFFEYQKIINSSK